MKKVLKSLGLILLLIVGSLFIYNLTLIRVYRAPGEAPDLSVEEVSDMLYTRELLSRQGEAIWPGFGKADIPLIFYNDRYEFLHGYSPSEDGWLTMESSANAGGMHRRDARNPQAFAVPVDDRWVASIGTNYRMNRELFHGIRKEVPKVFAYIFPFFVFKVSREMQISVTLHEMFHVWEANCNESKFLASEESHAELHDYPYDNRRFAEYWDREGEWLAKSLKAKDQEQFYACVDSFLYIRQLRRNNCDLSSRHISAEKGLEWLEGMAKYAEYRGYLLAASVTHTDYKFKSKNAYWQREQADRLRRMGNHGGDNRFYHSGAAQAFILDGLNESWKSEIMKDGIYLEDLIKKYRESEQQTSNF